MKGQEAYIGPTLLLLLEPAEMIGEAWTSTAICYCMDEQQQASHIASQAHYSNRRRPMGQRQ